MNIRLILSSCAATLLMTFSYSAWPACDCGSVDPANACTGNSVEYSREGRNIRFEFSCDGGVCACGKFANGWDFWVAPRDQGGQVTITDMLPRTTGIGTSNVRNGAQADALRMNGHGFTGPNAGSYLGSIDPSLTISTPYALTPAEIGRPTVILKSISETSGLCNSSDRVCLDYVETLTVLAVPPGNVFRPPFYGTEKPMVPASDFDASFLSELAPVSGNVSWDQALRTTASVNVKEFVSNWNDRQGLAAAVNNQTNAGYEASVNVTQILALLKLTERAASRVEADQKQQLAKQIAQRGIDLYHIHKNGWGQQWGNVDVTNGPCGAWIPNGGFNSGKLVPIIFAAALLDKSDWLATLNTNISSHDGRSCFSETGFVQPAMGIGKNIALFGMLTTSMYGVSCSESNPNCADVGGKYGYLSNYEGEADGDPLGDSGSPTNYQAIQTSLWLGSAMAVWLTPAVREIFPSGASHWLEYVERSRQFGVAAGTDFGVYADKGSYQVTGYNAVGYDNPYFYALWDTYKKCSDNGSCAGMEPVVAPMPPSIQE